jgi:glycosyltransferase involved in cell wall biosynthesis
MATLRARPIKLAFSVRGNREQMLREAVAGADVNVSFCEFAPAERLEARLSAADIHVVSLHPEWTGTVVPSKFFGAIAAGRPVLFAGSPESAVAKWIQEYDLGWVLTPRNVNAITKSIRAYASSPEQQNKMRQHCFEVYKEHFCRERVLDCYDKELRLVLPSENSVEVVHCSAAAMDTERSREGL